MVMPPLVYSTLSSGGTVTLGKSTMLVAIESSIAGTVDFEATDGTDPTGALSPVPIQANTREYFDVKPGSKIRFD